MLNILQPNRINSKINLVSESGRKGKGGSYKGSKLGIRIRFMAKSIFVSARSFEEKLLTVNFSFLVPFIN